MPNAIYSIVEGSGEVQAVPLLIRRILHEKLSRSDIKVQRPYNANGRSNLIKADGLEKYLNFVRRECDACAGVLVLLDAERENVDAPQLLIDSLIERANRLGLSFNVEIVCSICEYESWFLASLPSICLHVAELNPNLRYENDPDQQCSAKEWLTKHMKRGQPYNETYHQVRMTQWLDLEMTHQRSASFRMFVGAVERLVV